MNSAKSVSTGVLCSTIERGKRLLSTHDFRTQLSVLKVNKTKHLHVDILNHSILYIHVNAILKIT